MSSLDILRNIAKNLKKPEDRHYNDNVLILDGLNNFIRVWSVNSTDNENGLHIGGISGFLQTLGIAIRTVNPTRVVVVFDGRDGSKVRKKIFPGYKANRGHGLRRIRKNNNLDDDKDRARMKLQLKRLIKYLQSLPITFILNDGLEADDVIGYLCTNVFNKSESVYISSVDKDFYQLIKNNVKIFNPVTKLIITKDTIREKYNMIPENFILYKSVEGDKSDNVPGVKGVGLKTFIKHIPIITEEKQLDINDIINYINSHILLNEGKISKSQLALAESKSLLEMNYRLMNLVNNEISSSSKLDIVNKINNTNKLNMIKLFKLFKEDKMGTTFKDFPGFIKINFGYLNKMIK